MADHTSADHMLLARRFVDAMAEEQRNDPSVCMHCAMVGASVAKLVALQMMLEGSDDSDRVEIEAELDEAVRERLTVGRHRSVSDPVQ